MSNIIEMLMDNPFIIVVILGILSSVFSKMKAPQQQQHERTPPKRTTSGRNSASPVSETRRMETYNAPVETVETFKAEASDTNELLQRAERAEQAKKRSKVMDNPITMGAIENSDITKPKQMLDQNPKSILQGFIWAEVLSPPKSKRKSNI
ncbi:hypothetical protein GCM10008967_34330 [Bacillus carboniphilus]|uniref:Uncharacterized protein n=1 Tax=Bacillus carboniphilus TaxID=86663 RepID=A0ABP3GDF3_9BACI